MDRVSEIRLAQVHPELSRRIHKMVAAIGTDIRVTAGIRSVAQQNALWQIGRDAQGNRLPGEATVTNAKGTQSNHVLGFAVDLVTMDVQGMPQWNDQPWVSVAGEYGLRSGAQWGDKPHVELSEVPATPTLEAQQTYLQAGVQAVWEGIDLPVTPTEA